jgi:hypothetical protein
MAFLERGAGDQRPADVRRILEYARANGLKLRWVWSGMPGDHDLVPVIEQQPMDSAACAGITITLQGDGGTRRYRR